MAATLVTAPPERGYNGDDNWIKFSTDLIESDPVARISIEIATPGPSLGEVITIEWAGNTVEFTVEATTNPEATGWPVKSGGDTLADYALQVVEAIRQNGIITESWQVISLGPGGSGEIIELVYKERVVLDVTVTESLSNVFPTVTDGWDPLLEPNLACLVQIWKAEADANDDALLGSLHSPYDVIPGTTEFNLKDYFDLGPHLPTEASIDPGIITEWPHGVATNAWLEYYLRANDKHGTPAVPLALIKTESNYFMLHGSRSADHDEVSTLGVLIPLHRYRRRDGEVFRKPLTEFMPDYGYIWALAELTDCNVEFVFTWSDGTDTTEAYSGTDFTMAEKSVHWIRSTPFSFAYPPPNANDFPEYITFKLKGDGGAGLVTLMEVKYTVKITPDWQAWILFDNGLGGCETALFYGKTKNGLSVARDTSRRQRTSDFTIAAGEVVSVGAEGQKTFEMSTGWVEKYYAEHLQQMLLGDVWMIDLVGIRFIKLVCESTSVVPSKDDETLFSLEVNFKASWYDTAINL